MGNVIPLYKGIDSLTTSNLIRLDDPVDEGLRAFTQPCFLRWGDGSETRAYLKVFDSSLSTCVINELTGFAIGKACNLPLPNKIGLLKLPNEFVEVNKCCEWAVVVSEVPGNTLKSIYKSIGEQKFLPIFDKLFQWSRIEEVLAFDDWIANGDRNIGNVVLTGPGSYYLIDHSDALVKPNWLPNDLDPCKQVNSVLAIDYQYCIRADEDNKNKLVFAANNHATIYSRVSASLEEIWKEGFQLLFNDDAERMHDALRNFIQERAVNSVKRIEENPTLLRAS